MCVWDDGASYVKRGCYIKKIKKVSLGNMANTNTSPPPLGPSLELQAFIAEKQKNPYHPTKTIESLREETERSAAKAMLPDGVRVRAVNAGGRPCEWHVNVETEDSKEVFLFFYGGGYYRGSVVSSRAPAAWISKEGGVRVLCASYRLAPENPFPAALEDALAVYRWLLDTGHMPEHISVGGVSAGGGLCLALMLAAREQGLPLPKAAVPMSPWTDLTQSGNTYVSKAKEDPVIEKDYLQRFAELYLNGTDARTPFASPLFADLAGLPPMLLQVGSRETMLDDTLRFAEKAQKTAVKVKVSVWQGAIHAWQNQPHILPEARQALQELTKFIKDTQHA